MSAKQHELKVYSISYMAELVGVPTDILLSHVRAECNGVRHMFCRSKSGKTKTCYVVEGELDKLIEFAAKWKSRQDPSLLRMPDAAKAIGMPHHVFRALVNDGHGPPIAKTLIGKNGRRMTRYRVEDLKAWAEAPVTASATDGPAERGHGMDDAAAGRDAADLIRQLLAVLTGEVTRE